MRYNRAYASSVCFNAPALSCRRLYGKRIDQKARLLTVLPRASSESNSDVDLSPVAKAVADMTTNNQIIGLGTGLAINEVIKELAQRLTDGRLEGIKFIPSSDVSASEAAFHGLPLTTLADSQQQLDILFDEADEIDLDSLSYIVARGQNGPQANQPSLIRLRELLNAATSCVAIASEDHINKLGGDLPVVIDGDDGTWEETAEELDDIFLGDAEIRRRSYDVEAGPRGGNNPVVTAEGNMVLDIQFYDGIKLFGESVEYEKVIEEIESVPGIVAHGLVSGERVKGAVVYTEKGEVRVIDK